MSFVVVDIDGTLADARERAAKYLSEDPKDWDSFYEACDQDKPIQTIIDLVVNLSDSYDILLLTGRRSIVRGKTIDWLKKHGLDENIYWLKMRKDGDYRPDTEVKPEMLDAFLKDMKETYGKIEDEGKRIFDVAFILEDRNSMVNKWRELGYTCLQPAEGDF